MEIIYDTLIIGGGPAGLAAAVYLARLNRSCIVLDTNQGRWNSYEITENYLGFPDGIPSKELHALGIVQAKKFGAIYCQDFIQKVSMDNGVFIAVGKQTQYKGKCIIFATGVTDDFPHFHLWRDYVGRSLFWCIVCDGYKTRNKKIAIVGPKNDEVITALQFLNFTSNIVFITNTSVGKDTITDEYKTRLKHANIPFYAAKIQSVVGHEGQFETLILEDNQVVSLDIMISPQDPIPKSELPIMLGVTVDDKGYILTTMDQRTNIPFVYAAGDVIKPFEQQIVSAAHEGATAAQAANYDLYLPEQK